MSSKKSFSKNFKVEETKGKAAEGPDSLLSLNEQIVNAKSTGEAWEPMWRLCLVCANQRKLIAKVRGDSNDFLSYATMGYLMRWKRQYEPQQLTKSGKETKRIPVKQIQNWIPYILSTIRFSLITYNKEVYDYDFLPLPKVFDDMEEGNAKDIPDSNCLDALSLVTLQALSDKGTLHQILLSLPEEVQPYLLDILYYIRMKGVIISRSAENYIKIGKNLLGKEIELWMME